jgi:predicted nucleic acid-binding protein
VIVLDASAALEVFARTPLGVRHEARVMSESRHAPHLIDVELLNALRRMTLANVLDTSTAQAAIADFLAARFDRHAHEILLSRAWELRNSISAYDAMYIALAELLDAPLLTCDAKLSRSHGHRANIVLLS